MCITNPLKISDFQGNLLHMLLFLQKHAFYFSILRIKEGLLHVQQPLGATGRIRTSGLPGRRTTTGRRKWTLKRELYWFCTFAAKTGKSLLSVITTGFSGILWCRCTVVVKWWSIFQTDGKGSLPLSLTISSFHSCF